MTPANTTIEQGIHVVSPEGGLDYDHALKLFEVVQPLVAQPGEKVLLDLGKVTMISSMGYVVLVQFLKTAQKTGSHLRLCNLQGIARENLEIMRFDGLKAATLDRQDVLTMLDTETGAEKNSHRP